MSALVGSEILTMFFNTLTTAAKYSRRNMLNFTKQIEAPLSQKEKSFSALFIPFLKCALNLEHFQKKDEYPSQVISKVIDPEIGSYLNI